MGLFKALFGDPIGTEQSCPYCGASTPPGRRPAGYDYSLDGPNWAYRAKTDDTRGGFALREAEWQDFVCWDACCREHHPPIVSGAWCRRCLGLIRRSDSNWEWREGGDRIEPWHSGVCPPRRS